MNTKSNPNHPLLGTSSNTLIGTANGNLHGSQIQGAPTIPGAKSSMLVALQLMSVIDGTG